jgi:hypothetical protein
VKRFVIGFLAALLAVGVANVISYYVRTDAPGADDAIRRAGFPFLVWEEGGLSYRHYFSYTALLVNVVAAVCLGSFVGVLAWRSAR